MIDIRPFESLGTFQNDWLKAHYHFSFSGYHDDTRTHWGALRVWNDDTISPKTASTATATRTWRSSPMSAAA